MRINKVWRRNISKKLREKYPLHYKKFHDMQYSSDPLPWGDKSFRMFVEAVGPVPEDMLNPSIGRINHTKTHTLDNIRWQEWELNKAEAHFRNNWLIPRGFKTWDDLLLYLRNQ